MHRLALVTAYEALEMAGHVNGQGVERPAVRLVKGRKSRSILCQEGLGSLRDQVVCPQNKQVSEDLRDGSSGHILDRLIQHNIHL